MGFEQFTSNRENEIYEVKTSKVKIAISVIGLVSGIVLLILGMSIEARSPEHETMLILFMVFGPILSIICTLLLIFTQKTYAKRSGKIFSDNSLDRNMIYTEDLKNKMKSHMDQKNR